MLRLSSIVFGALLWTGCPAGAPVVDDDSGEEDEDIDGDDDTIPANQPPNAPVVTIDPAYPSVCDSLRCEYEATPEDPDGDFVTYGVAWIVDGAPFAPEVPDRVDAEDLAEGQVWTCEVTPNDGQVDGSPGSATVEIGSPDVIGGRAGIRLEASGTVAGGPADVYLDWELVDCLGAAVCTASYEFDAEYTYGPAQAGDFPAFVDEVVTWTAGSFVGDDCSPGLYTPVPDPVEHWRWALHPMAFVSCDRIVSEPDVGDLYLGMDDSGYIPTADGTFGDYCVTVGPAIQVDEGSGPIEAVWLVPGVEGELASLGDFGYFPAPDPTHVQGWHLGGLLMQDSGNVAEPVEGLDGGYLIHGFWYWLGF